MKLQQKPNGQYVITVDKSLVNAKGWTKGQELEWTLDGNGRMVLEESD